MLVCWLCLLVLRSEKGPSDGDLRVGWKMGGRSRYAKQPHIYICRLWVYYAMCDCVFGYKARSETIDIKNACGYPSTFVLNTKNHTKTHRQNRNNYHSNSSQRAIWSPLRFNTAAHQHTSARNNTQTLTHPFHHPPPPPPSHVTTTQHTASTLIP